MIKSWQSYQKTETKCDEEEEEDENGNHTEKLRPSNMSSYVAFAMTIGGLTFETH